MNLIICSSFFQLYTALTIKEKYYKNEQFDLALYSTTPLFRQLKDNEQVKSMFNNVYFLDYSKKVSKFKKKGFFKPLYEAFPCLYFKNFFGFKVKKYNKLLFCSQTTTDSFISRAVKQKNKKAEIYRYEDGISTYLIDDVYPYKSPRWFKKLFKICQPNKIINGLYLFEPQLYCANGNIKLIKIDKNFDDDIVRVFDKIFGKEVNVIKEKFIFFEESFNNDGLKTNDASLIENAYRQCGQDFILKNHPRNSANRFSNGPIPTIENFIFWEHYLQENDISDKTLITITSNTCIVPYILSNAKPNVIFMYKMFEGIAPIARNKNFNSYIEKYKNLYKGNSKKIFFPNNEQEFNEIIKNIKGGNNDESCSNSSNEVK